MFFECCCTHMKLPQAVSVRMRSPLSRECQDVIPFEHRTRQAKNGRACSHPLSNLNA